MGIPNLVVTGPATGTYTATPTANRLGVYMWAGGGSGRFAPGPGFYSIGGSGGGGFYNKPITQPFSQPYTVGAGANTGGGAGSPTTFTNVGTVNAGAGAPGPGNVDGTPGTSPGAGLNITGKNIISSPGRIQYLTYQCGSNTYIPLPTWGNGVYKDDAVPGCIVIFENTGT
jgi:hypothetical protein